MTATRNPDEIISVWLDQMPDRVPDRVIDAVLQAAQTTPQVRRILVRGPRRLQLTNRLVMVAATIALVVVLVGGAAFLAGGLNNFGPTPSPTPTPTPTVTAASTASSGPGGPIPAQLQARWMSDTRDFASNGAGTSLLLDAQRYAFSLSNNNGTPVVVGPVGSTGPGELSFGNGPLYGCSAYGQYNWELSSSGRVLTITLATDDCARRAGDMPGTYWLTSCKDPGTDCLGDLDAGTYASQYIRPLPVLRWAPLFGGVTYTVPEGWANFSDWPDTLGLTSSADYANTTSTSVEPAAAIEVMTDAKALSAPCSETPSDSQATANEVLTTLGGNIDVTGPTAITIGGYSGAYVDVTQSATPAPSGPGRSTTVCSGDTPFYYAAGAAQGINGQEKQRLILLDLPDGHLLAILVWSEKSRFDSFSTAAMPIVQSMTFK